MKKYRLIISALLVLFTAVLLAGCGQGTAAADTQQTQGGSQAQATAPASEENTIYGNVTAIDGSSITLELGTLNQEAMPGGQDGAPPAGAQGSGQAGEAPSGMPSDLPSGGQPSGMPSGEQPPETPSDGARPSMLTLTGETKTITISDESIITVTGQDSQKTGLAAVREGSTLKVVFAQDGQTIQSVVVLNGGGGFPGGADGKENAPSAS